MELIDVHNQQYGIQIHQLDEQLPWLMMLHGFMGNSRVFSHLISDLSSCCNPVTVDLLGHGQSSKPTDPERYREEYQVKDLADLIRKLGLSPLFLHGYSMGGRLALKLALKHAELFRGLILESTTNGIEDESARKERRKTDQTRAKKIEKHFSKFLEGWEKADLFQSPLSEDKRLVGRYKKIHLSQQPGAMAASLRGFGTGFMEPETEHFPGFGKPTIIMAGSADKKYQRIARNQLAPFFSNGHLCFIEAGHRLHLDNPPEFINEIEHHINSNSFL